MNFQEAWSVRHGVAPLLDLCAWGGGLGVLGIAFLLGLALLPRLGGWRPGDRWLLRLLAGLAAAPLVLLGAGQIPGAIFACPWWALGLAGWAAFFSTLVWQRKSSFKSSPGSGASEGVRASGVLARLTALAGWGVVGLSLLGPLMPAFCPPLAYDTLEYHQGIIPHIFQLGRVAPIPHVFYSAQPLATEMLYTLAALIEGTPWGYAPGVIHWALVVLVALVTARILARLGIAAAWCPWLVLLLLEHFLMFKLQVERMSDWFGVLMLAGGLWVCLEGMRNEGDRDTGGLGGRSMALSLARAVRTAALMGFLVGGAMEAKWTHAGTVALPLLLLALALGWDAWKTQNSSFLIPHSAFRLLLPALVCGLVGFALWLPWGVWLAVVRGNPFHPFLASLFPSPEWPPERLHFLLAAHEPLRPTQASYWSNLFHRLATGLDGAPVILLALAGAAGLALLLRLVPGHDSEAIPAGGSSSPARRFAFRLALGMAGSLLLWGNLRQAADRFLGPTLLAAVFVFAVVLSEVLALLERQRPRWRRGFFPRTIVTGLLAVLALVNLSLNLQMLAPQAAHAQGRLSRSEYLDLVYSPEMSVVRAVNALPPSARVLALNDARRYLYTGQIELASVFDRSPIRPAVTGATDADTIRRRLIGQGFTHVLYNGFEQVRILRMQTPLALARDPQFKAILAVPEEDLGGANAILATRYRGLTEFSVDPLTPGERKAYVEFLDQMRSRATAVVPAASGAEPAFWLAPLQ